MNLTELLFPYPRAPAVPLSLFRRCLRLLIEVREAIPDPGPGIAEEGSITGFLFEGGPEIVARVVRALRQDRRWFPGFPNPQPLWQRQLRACGWRVLNGVLVDLCHRTAVYHRLEQS